MVNDVEVGEPLGKSDHSVVTFSFTCETSIADTSTEKFLYDRGDYDRMRHLVSTHDWELLLRDLDVCGKRYSTASTTRGGNASQRRS